MTTITLDGQVQSIAQQMYPSGGTRSSITVKLSTYQS
jgi:hypothetical protein